MALQRTVINQFAGGISNNSKTGLPNSCKFSRFLDIYSDTDSVSLNPKASKVSGSTVTGLVKWIADGYPYDTNKYFYADNGIIYRETSGGVWSAWNNMNNPFTETPQPGSTGQGMTIFNDILFAANNTQLNYIPFLSLGLSAVGYVSGATFINNQSGGTFTIPTTDVNNNFTFTATNDPLFDIILKVNAKGTGNWTVRFRDANLNTIGSITLANANIGASFATFQVDYSTATTNTLRLIPGQTYTVYVTSTVADGSIVTAATNLASAAYHQLDYSALVYGLTYVPMATHTDGTQGIMIYGNSNYIGTVSRNVTGQIVNALPNKITLEPGYQVRYFVRENEYQIAMCWKGTNIDSYEEGRAFYWDGVSPYYNYSKPITGGSPNSSVNFKNRIFSVLGSSGTSNLGTEPFKIIQPLPKLGRGKKVEVLPAAMTTWQTRAQIGYPGSTDDTTGLEAGVYEFGSQSDRAIASDQVSTEVLNYGFKISTGNTSNVTIGAVAGFGKDMYITWKDTNSGTVYGVDKVSKTSDPSATGAWESLIMDVGVAGKQLTPLPEKQKLASRITVNFEPLPSGCTVTPKYKIDRATNFTSGTAATAGNTYIIQEIDLRYYEIEIGFDVTASTNYPKILSIYFEFDGLENERDDN